jgi:hypothetical protein
MPMLPQEITTERPALFRHTGLGCLLVSIAIIGMIVVEIRRSKLMAFFGMRPGNSSLHA